MMITQTVQPPESGKFPKRITLELTSRCNISCVFCPRKLLRGKQGDLDVGLAKRLIDEMAEHLPVTLVPFFRGEPLLHPDWFEILYYAKEKGIGPIQLTSNGILLDEQNIEKILDLEIDFISFSLDTVDKELYERTRRGGNYDEVVANIKQLIYRKQARGLVKPEIQVSAVETDEHKKGMDAFISYWQPQVDRVRVYVEHSQDGNLGKIDKKLPIMERRLPCHKVFTDLVIYWNGKTALCNHDWTRKTKLAIGDLNDSSIASVWTSIVYGEIREMHRKGKMEGVEPCNTCDHWKMYYIDEGFLGRVIQSQGGLDEK